jgi:signal transduction histidine kinase
LGRVAAATFHPDDKDRIQKYNTGFQEGKFENYESEYRVVTKQGETRWQHSKATTVKRDARGRPIRIVGTVQDITQRKQAEEEIFRQQSLLNGVIQNSSTVIFVKDRDGRYQLVKQMEVALVQASEAAEAATAAKAEFLATMSHEIRTPMGGVMSMAEILDQTKLSSDQKSMTRTIRQSAQALMTVINDILDFSKIEAGKLEFEHISFDMAEVVQSTADLLAPRADEASLDLFVHFDPNLPKSLLGDPTRIRQILLNLGSNAIKFTSEGHVEFKVRQMARNGKARVRIEVTDTGIGLTEEQKGNLFQAFAQADTSTSRKFGGTGLGLSICKRLCEMMGGVVDVDSEPGVGSTFWFEVSLDIGDEAPYSPAVGISDARVLLAGYGTHEASILRDYERHHSSDRRRSPSQNAASLALVARCLVA